MNTFPHGLSGVAGVAYLHRGIGGFPANTLETFQAAIDGGYAIRANGRRTRDGVLVCADDSMIEEVHVEETDCDELLRRRPNLVTAEQLFQLCRPDTVVVMELMFDGTRVEHGPLERAMVDALGRHGRQRGSITAVSSLSPGSLREMRRVAPKLPRLQVLDGLTDHPPLTADTIGELLDAIRAFADGVSPRVNDLIYGERPWVKAAHARALGVFPYPPRTTEATKEPRAGVLATIRAGCDGGFFDDPWTYQDAWGDQALRPADAMQAFLEARRLVADGLGRAPTPTVKSYRRLVAQLIEHGAGTNLSMGDVYDASIYAVRLRGTGALTTRCEELIGQRTG